MDARTIQARSINNPGESIERVLSQSLFSEIKPNCIELSQTALLPSPIFKPDSPRLISALATLKSSLDSHYKLHIKNGPYKISANIADYIFFPISNLLKQPLLSDPAVSHILYIIGFLVRNAWSKNVNLVLIDQLLPLVIYLSGGKTIQSSSKVSEIINKDLSFKNSAVFCLSNLIEVIPSTYFSEGEAKRLSFLGDSTTILLDVLTSLSGATTQEHNEVSILILDTLQTLYTHKVTAEQTSYVFPGVTSKVINFATLSQKLHFSVIVKLLRLLQNVIINVFSDDSLKIELIDQNTIRSNLHDLNEFWEESDKENDGSKSDFQPQLYIKMEKGGKSHRSEAWLRATSNQLKLSLTVFFKDLLNTSTKKHKVQTKDQLFEEIMSFQKAISNTCFYSLFLELIPLSLDIISLTIATINIDATKESEHTHNSIKAVTDSFLKTAHLDQNKLNLLHSQLKLKIDDLIEHKMSLVFFSTDDERIYSFLVSVKFHFSLLNSISNGIHEGRSQSQSLITKLIIALKKELVNSFVWSNEKKKKTNKNELLALLGGSKRLDDATPDNNKLDEIELPPHINAKQISKIKNSRSELRAPQNKRDYSMNLALLAREWERGEVMQKSVALESHYFKGSYSKFVESQIVDIIQYLTTFEAMDGAEKNLIEVLLASNDGDIDTKNHVSIIDKGISLWMANSILKSPHSKKEPLLKEDEKSFDINNYLQFDDDVAHENHESTDYTEGDGEDLYYMVMAKSQEIIDNLNDPEFLSPEYVDSSTHFSSLKIYETAYAIAIDSMGVLSNHLTYEDFQSDYLIYYFYPLLEALTYNTNPLIQIHAANALTTISDNYSQGSLKQLIMQNSDYLIDSFSSKLSIPSSLTPTLPGILFIILKISGMSLLQSNQLQDILSHIFILIDSYHGYSILVEGFFMVFEEIIKQIDDLYVKSADSLYDPTSNVHYKPWGLANFEEMIKVIHDSPGNSDLAMEGYDSSKEYFQRKAPNMPFGDEEDSDDESNEFSDTESNEPTESDDKWVSTVPKNVYLTAQQIFNYGFRLLLHPSISLRFQILKTLKRVYSTLSTDYRLVMPFIAQHWPVLLTLISGSSNLSEIGESVREDAHSLQTESLIAPSLELVIKILDEDGKQSQPFLGSKFLDAWDFLSNHSKVLSGSAFNVSGKGTTEKSMRKVNRNQTLHLDPKTISLYVRFLIRGLNYYERRIPDVVRYDILRACSQFGIPTDEPLSKDIKNNLWVINRKLAEKSK